MKRVEGVNIHWHRHMDSPGLPELWFAVTESGRTIGAVGTAPPAVDKYGRPWESVVYSQTNPSKRMYAYAASVERAKYFVECWAKYHVHQAASQ